MGKYGSTMQRFILFWFICRLVSILPNKLLGVLGDHGGMPIERVVTMAGGEYIASCGHDSNLRLWSLQNDTVKQDETDGDDSDSDSFDEVVRSTKKKPRFNVREDKGIKDKKKPDNAFFSGLEIEDEDNSF
jgi:hypothetical protein